jgi:hypothetical protein
MRSIPSLALAVALTISALTLLGAESEPAPEREFDGFNVIVAQDHPFGGESAKLALT